MSKENDGIWGENRLAQVGKGFFLPSVLSHCAFLFVQFDQFVQFLFSDILEDSLDADDNDNEDLSSGSDYDVEDMKAYLNRQSELLQTPMTEKRVNRKSMIVEMDNIIEANDLEGELNLTIFKTPLAKMKDTKDSYDNDCQVFVHE